MYYDFYFIENVNGDEPRRHRKCFGIMALKKPCVNGTGSLSSPSEPKPPKPRMVPVDRSEQGNNTKDYLAKRKKNRKHSP